MAHDPRHRHHRRDPLRGGRRSADRLRRDEDHQLRPWRASSPSAATPRCSSPSLGLNPWWSLPFAFVIGFVCGMVIERLVVRPLYARPLDAILATWGLGIIIGQVITLAFGRERAVRPEPGDRRDRSARRLLFGVPAASWCSSRWSWPSRLRCVLNGTRLGLVTRAVIMNENLARGLGINSGLVRFVTFSLGAGLASLAGALITPLVERRSQHGRALAGQRLHAGHGLRRVAGEPGRRLPGARRRAGAGQHLRQSRSSAASPSSCSPR